MENEVIQQYWQELSDFKAGLLDGKAENSIKKDLQALAIKVNASTETFDTSTGNPRTMPASTSELIRNIHQALQTATMVNMCMSASKGYEIAADAIKDSRKTVWFTIASVIAAWLAAFAAWAAVF